MRLIVLDCDGVISKGEAQPFNPALFARLADLNRRARRGEAVPAVTLNTGRPSPYVEAVMQAIEGWQPALFENGAGMYLPGPYQFKTTPLLTQTHKTALRQIVQRLDREFVQPGHLYWQPGKSVCHSLFAHPPRTISEFLPDVQATVAQISADFVAVPAVLALNIYPAHITKGSGLRWLAGEAGIAPAEMGGVGDSSSDVDFLRLVGRPAAPANATGDVKSVAEFVASGENAAGLLQILDYWQV
ncbi:MAG: hypothetical protein D6768_19975 [Chloroflexi bacterium]|nr:MAG: hypothetical protein D6768_19975 [Chloroflexota bacterium]